MTRQARHRTVIAQKEHQIGKLRDEVERLRKILLERDTGTGENRETVLSKNRNTEDNARILAQKRFGPLPGGQLQSVDCMMPSSRDMSR